MAGEGEPGALRAHNWLGVEMRHLAALRGVAEEGTFGGAGRRLGYSQSAISGQIATLERLVGERLLERIRGSRRVGLTTAGETLLVHAESMLATLHEAQADLARGGADRDNGLAIGLFSPIGSALLPVILQRFRRRQPSVALEFVEAAPDRRLQQLTDAGELDLTFTVSPIVHRSLACVELIRDPFVLVVQEATGRTVEDALCGAAEVFALPACATQTGVEELLRDSGLTAPIVRLGDLPTIRALVGAGSGVALLPSFAAASVALPILALDTSFPDRSIVIAWRKERTLPQAAAEFVELAVDASRALLTAA